jgi:hypothetical protein
MDFEDAAELKSFAWYLDHCLCLTKLDDDGVGKMKASAARNSKSRIKRMVQLLGGMATFIPRDTDMAVDRETGKYVDKDALHRMPGSGAAVDPALFGRPGRVEV